MRINLIGLVMLVVAGAVGSGFVWLVGSSNRDLALLVAGPLLGALDLSWRRARQATLFGSRGGTFVFLPVWLWAIPLTVAGVLALRGH